MIFADRETLPFTRDEPEIPPGETQAVADLQSSSDENTSETEYIFQSSEEEEGDFEREQELIACEVAEYLLSHTKSRTSATRGEQIELLPPEIDNKRSIKVEPLPDKENESPVINRSRSTKPPKQPKIETLHNRGPAGVFSAEIIPSTTTSETSGPSAEGNTGTGGFWLSAKELSHKKELSPLGQSNSRQFHANATTDEDWLTRYDQFYFHPDSQYAGSSNTGIENQYYRYPRSYSGESLQSAELSRSSISENSTGACHYRTPYYSSARAGACAPTRRSHQEVRGAHSAQGQRHRTNSEPRGRHCEHNRHTPRLPTRRIRRPLSDLTTNYNYQPARRPQRNQDSYWDRPYGQSYPISNIRFYSEDNRDSPVSADYSGERSPSPERLLESRINDLEKQIETLRRDLRNLRQSRRRNTFRRNMGGQDHMDW